MSLSWFKKYGDLTNLYKQDNRSGVKNKNGFIDVNFEIPPHIQTDTKVIDYRSLMNTENCPQWEYTITWRSWKTDGEPKEKS